jgi:hypothetical protein
MTKKFQDRRPAGGLSASTAVRVIPPIASSYLAGNYAKPLWLPMRKRSINSKIHIKDSGLKLNILLSSQF